MMKTEDKIEGRWLVDGIRRLHFKGGGLAGECLNKDLQCVQAKAMRKSHG